MLGMTIAALFLLQESEAIGWDLPVSIWRDPGIFERVVIATLLVMACWIAVAVLRALWSRHGARGLKVIAQTAPMVGLLGTTVVLISGLINFSHDRPMALNVLAVVAADALVTTATGLVVGIAAHFASAFVERGKPIK